MSETPLEGGEEDPKNNPLFKLFVEQLHPLLLANDFVMPAESSIEASTHRFKIGYTLSKINTHGEVTVHRIDVIAMPMASVLMLVFGKIAGDEKAGDVKIKIKASEPVEQIKRRFREEFIKKLQQLLSLNLEEVPPELKVHILRYLPVRDIVSLSQTNTNWGFFCSNEDMIWKNLYKNDFKTLAPQKQEDMSWREVYKRTFIRRRSEQEEAMRRECWRVRGLPPPIPIPMLPGLPPRLAIGPPPLHIFPQFPDLGAPEPELFPPYHPFARPRGPFGGFGGGFF